MTDRKVLKTAAKVVLSRTYRYSFVVCVIFYLSALLLGNAGNIFSWVLGLNNKYLYFVAAIINSPVRVMLDIVKLLRAGTFNASDIILSNLTFVSFFIFVTTICINAFIINPLTVGKNLFFLDGRKGNKNIRQLFSLFKSGSYIKTVKTVFMRDLVVWLWSLLIIPGIYFGFAYCLVPYICAENPGIDAKKARELSKKITDGFKLDIFVFDLSFMGWYFLAIITIVGILFVKPYSEASFAELYMDLRDSAIQNDVISYEELMSSTS